jgi:hypothetical protein
VACRDLQYFSTLFHKRYDFREKKIGHNLYIVIFSTPFSETFLIPRTKRHMIKNVYWSSCKEPVIVRPVGAVLFQADRQTDGHDEANIRFSPLFERP